MRLIAGMLVGVLAEAAAAQSSQPVRIDPGYRDRSPSAISLRKMDMDLRREIAFENVYQMSTIDAFGTKHETFLRYDGAVTAVFARSVYVPLASGLSPDVPPGTIFYIGPPPEVHRSTYVSPTFLDLSVGSEPVVEAVPERPRAVVGSIITDEAYRQRRIEALLAFAIER